MSARLRLGCVLALACTTVRAGAEPSEDARVEASEFRLVWSFGDDDVLHPAELSRPPSPSASAGDRPGYDPLVRDVHGRFTGRENFAFLQVGADAPAFVPGLHSRALLSLGADLTAATERASEAPPFVDLGSHLELEQALAGAASVTLRVYPLDGDVERVGALDALAFGGAVGVRRDSPYREASRRPSAARLSLRASGVELFAALKTASFIEPASNGTALEATSYGVLAGVTSDVGEYVRLGVSAGHFEHGVLSSIPAASVPATTSGLALRASFGVGSREPPATFAFGPTPSARLGSVDFIPDGFAFGAEWVALGMRRARFERPSEARLAPARGGALLGAVRAGVFEARAAAIYRDPELVMRNAGGVFPGFTLPLAAAARPELSFLLVPRVLIHPALSLGLGLAAQLPGAVMTFGFDRQGYPSGASLLVRGPGDWELLPPGRVPQLIAELRPTLDLRFSKALALSAWLSYRRDDNRRQFSADFEDSSARGFAKPDFFGYGVALSGGR